MSITVAEIQTNLNTIIGDSSTDRISAAERLQFITEAVSWLKTEMDNDHSVRTHSLNYFDTINYYKLNQSVTDIFEGNEVRRAVGEDTVSFTRKAASEMAEDISQGSDESSFSLERRDNNLFLVVNHYSKYPALIVSHFESLTADGGTWEADTTTSDATNLSVDNVSFTHGSGSLSFDVDVSQSGNNRATILNDELTAEDLSDEKDVSSWVLDVTIPDVTYVTSYTFYWGSSASNYYSVTATTDINGNALVTGVNTLKFNWLGATVTGTPDDTAISYIRIDVNYSASQADATSFKLDYLRLIRPEILTFYYSSWNVGTNSGGTQIKAFTSTTDIPYFSGQYDNYKFPVAHKAAQLAYRSLRLYNESAIEENEAVKELAKIKNIIPKSRKAEQRNFKIRGVSFSRRGVRR